MSIRWGHPCPLVALIVCDHHDTTPPPPGTSVRCPACGAMISPPPHDPDQPSTVEVRGQ